MASIITQNKLIFTSKGLELAREAEEIQRGEQEAREVLRQQRLMRRQSALEESSQFVGQVLQTHTNSDVVNDNVIKQLNIVLTPGQQQQHTSRVQNPLLAQKKSLGKLLLRGNVQPTPFVRAQAEKYGKELLVGIRTRRQHGEGKKSSLENSIDSLYYQQNVGTGIAKINQLSRASSQIATLSGDDEGQLLEKYNHILFAENKIDRIYKRYEYYANTQNELQQRVAEVQRRKRMQYESDKLTRPHFLEELKRDNQDVIEILLRETRYKERQKQRFQEYCRAKYVNVWKKHGNLPRLTIQRGAATAGAAADTTQHDSSQNTVMLAKQASSIRNTQALPKLQDEEIL